MKVCGYCKKMYDDGKTYCNSCGKYLDKAYTHQDPKMSDNMQWGVALIIMGFCAFLIFCMMWAVFI